MRGKTTTSTGTNEHESSCSERTTKETHKEANCYARVFGWFQLFAVARVLYAPGLAPDCQGWRLVKQRVRVSAEMAC